MKITLSNGKELRGDLVPLLIVRTDLAAIPSTIECLIRVDAELLPLIQQGELLALAEKQLHYRIIFTGRQNDGIQYLGNQNYTLMKVIAVLDSCHKLAFIAERAVIKENTTLGAVYRACGATVDIGSDIKLSKFTCYKGDTPSFSIMRSMGLSACLPVWDGKNKIAFTRLRDLFLQNPAEKLPLDRTQEIKSGFLERHEIPAYCSNTADGSVIKSNASDGRRADYAMFCDKQELNNLSTYLVYRKIWTTGITPNLNAGEIVEIEGKKFVIITATHALSKVDSGSGSQVSRFWLGELSDNLVKNEK